MAAWSLIVVYIITITPPEVITRTSPNLNTYTSTSVAIGGFSSEATCKEAAEKIKKESPVKAPDSPHIACQCVEVK